MTRSGGRTGSSFQQILPHRVIVSQELGLSAPHFFLCETAAEGCLAHISGPQVDKADCGWDVIPGSEKPQMGARCCSNLQPSTEHQLRLEESTCQLDLRGLCHLC